MHSISVCTGCSIGVCALYICLYRLFYRTPVSRYIGVCALYICLYRLFYRTPVSRYIGVCALYLSVQVVL